MAIATVASGSCMRPAPATDQVQPAGSARTQSTRFSTDASSAPGTPSTKSTCAGRRMTPSAARRFALATCPRSNTSSSGITPYASMRAAIPRMIGKLFSNTSSPKLTVPQVSVAISGRRTSGAARSSGVIPIAPPVENWTIRSPASRIAACAARKRSTSCVFVPSSLRQWTCTIAAPAARIARAVAPSCSGVTGRYGV